MGDYSRRQFLQRSLFTSALAGTVGPVLRPANSAAAANDTIQLGVAGLGNKGPQHVDVFRAMDGVKVRSLCDVDQERLDAQAQKFRDAGEKIRTFTDPRRMLEDSGLDALVIAAPNHWHALLTIWACQSGKDVYVEKPPSHSIWEGNQMVKAARKYNRIVQAGTQRRSDQGRHAMLKYLRDEPLGPIRHIRCVYFRRRHSIGKVLGPQPLPGHIHYNLWTGPAPLRPLMRETFHYDWHWDWFTGNGDMGNNGVHVIDVARWFLGYDQFPNRSITLGGRYKWQDDGETPNTLMTYYDYEPAPIIFEYRNLPMETGSSVMDHYRGLRFNLSIQCEDGYIAGGWAYDNDGEKIRQFQLDGGGGHQANFMKAVRNRNRDDLNAEIAVANTSTALCHVGNISYMTGGPAAPASIRDALDGEPEALHSYNRMTSHLEAHGISLEEHPPVMGSWLSYNPDSRKFSGPGSEVEHLANSLVRRSYRKPFVVPERV